MIELLVVIAIIAVLIGLLLPAVQKVRETVNRTSATTDLAIVSTALRDSFDQNGEFPASMEDLLATAQLPPDATKDGYTFIPCKLKPDHVKILAEPVPGVTGSESAMLDGSLVNGSPVFTTSFFPTPGATQGRARMFARIDRLAAEAASHLAVFLPAVQKADLYGMILPYLNDPDREVGAVLGTLADADGNFTLASFSAGGTDFAFGDGSVRTIFSTFTERVLQAMQVGANNEDWMNLPSDVSIANVSPQLGVFTFAGLNLLTTEFVSDAHVQGQLLRMLRQAEQAADVGHEQQEVRWLDAYIGVITRMRGTELPAVQSNALILIAKSLE